jgi:UPF0755 protein
MKRILIIIALALLLAGIGSWRLHQLYQNFLTTPLMLPEQGHVLQIEPGSSGHAIIEKLAALGYTKTGWEWKLLMRMQPPLMRAGEFRLEPGLHPQNLLRIISSHAVVQYRLTLVEGWTFAQLMETLVADKVLLRTLGQNEISATGELQSLLGIEHPEGWFLPETYLYTRGDSDASILLRSHQAMQEMLGKAWRERQDNLPLNSPYDLLILASIIEKETALDAERNQISGVFIRRLNKGMRLQTDPTVIYGMGDLFDGNIRRKDLKTDTPYNTYTRSGLPPTPIAMPGKASLMAAGQPASGSALFFVADGKGGHTFSDTLEEHQAAVRKLIGKG